MEVTDQIFRSEHSKVFDPAEQNNAVPRQVCSNIGKVIMLTSTILMCLMTEVSCKDTILVLKEK